MTDIKCEFCENVFQNKSVLIQHQKKTKYCLKIQSESCPSAWLVDEPSKLHSGKSSNDTSLESLLEKILDFDRIKGTGFVPSIHIYSAIFIIFFYAELKRFYYML